MDYKNRKKITKVNNLLFYIFWITTLLVVTSLQAYFSVKNNDSTNWNPVICIIGTEIFMLPLWPLVSKYSNSLLFDANLYDIAQFSVYSFVLVILGASSGYTTTQYLGFSMICIGFFIVKFF